MADTFRVPSDRLRLALLRKHVTEIECKFGVTVCFGPQVGSEHQMSLIPAESGSRTDGAETAKAYILSLIHGSSKGKLHSASDAEDCTRSRDDKVEVIQLEPTGEPNNNAICLNETSKHNWELGVPGTSKGPRLVDQHQQLNMDNLAVATNYDAAPECSGGMLKAPSYSPGPDSCNDSCYDSDGSPGSSRRNSRTQQLETHHHDVSRTVSDTLAAEYTDTDDVRGMNISHEACTSSLGEPLVSYAQSPDSSEELLLVPEYSAKIQFALKLGYTEDHLKAALKKVGVEAEQNELLNELIKIGSSDSIHICDLEKNENQSLNSASRAYIEDPLDIDILGHRPAGTGDDNLRPIVIDGSNVAMSHGGKDVFSCLGIKLAVDWFQQRGHKDVVVFVPQWRKEAHANIKDQEILDELEKEQILVYTPSRRIAGKRVICYDDRYILKLAAENGGIVVSNDNYRDLINEKPDYKKVVEERLLMYSFVNDRFMPPDDPLGRKGPNLESFLRKHLPIPECRPSVCPYGRKCTYGNKCKYYHPERGLLPHKPVTEQLAEKAKANMARHKERLELRGREISQGDGVQKIKLQATVSDGVMVVQKKALARKSSMTGNSKKTEVSRTKSLALDSTQMKVVKKDSAPFDSLPHTHVFSTLSEGAAVSSCNSETSDSTGVEHWNNNSDTHHQGRKTRAGTSWSTEKLQVPPHWTLPVKHHSLHTSYSDPTQIPQTTSFMDGHLALAKKLSDEGKKPDRQAITPPKTKFQHATSTESLRHMELINSRKTNQLQQEQTPRTHKKLNRQLSLSGNTDPRLQLSHYSHYTVHECKAPQQDKQIWSFSGSRDSQTSTEKIITRNQTIGHHCLTRHASQDGQSNFETQISHHNHQPVSRMASAPVTHQNAVSVHSKSVPTMNRQNSTSDPQIHSRSERYLDAYECQGMPPNFSRHDVQYGDRGNWVYSRHPHTGIHPSGFSEKYVTPDGQVFCFGSCTDRSKPLKMLPHSSQRGERVRVEVEPELHTNITPPQSGTLPGKRPAQSCVNSDMADVGPTVAPGKSILMQQMESSQKQLQSQSIIQHQISDSGLLASAVYKENYGTADTTPTPAQWHVYMALSALFPPELVQQVIMKHPQERDHTVLCEYLLALCKDKSK